MGLSPKNIAIITAVLIAVFVTGILLLVSGTSITQPASTNPPEEPVTTPENTNTEANAQVLSASTENGSYMEYSAQIVSNEQAKGKKVVLFFHAPWCPECKIANKQFTSRITEIPSDVALLKTDYDSNTELKKKYGVTYQHTFVQIDENGNAVTKWSGGDIESLKKYIR